MPEPKLKVCEIPFLKEDEQTAYGAHEIDLSDGDEVNLHEIRDMDLATLSTWVEANGKQDANKPTWNLFRGHVVGILHKAVGKQSQELPAGKIRRFNCRAKPSRYEDFTADAVDQWIYKVCSIVVPRLRVIAGISPGAGLWQCNLNLYKKNTELSFHRDDEDVDDVSQLSFYRASATYIVAQPPSQTSKTSETKLGLQVIAPNEDIYLHCKYGLVGQAIKQKKVKPIEVTKDRCVRTCLNEDAKRNILAVLINRAYTHGCHSFDAACLEDGSTRASLNFRFVQEEFWSELCEGRLPEQKEDGGKLGNVWRPS